MYVVDREGEAGVIAGVDLCTATVAICNANSLCISNYIKIREMESYCK